MEAFNKIKGQRVPEIFIVAFGIYFTHLYFSIVQEKIYNDPGREKFNYAEFVVLIQCTTGFFVSIICETLGISFTEQKSIIQADTKSWHFFKLKFTHSLVSTLAKIFTNTSLIYISYPTQALAKSCKILPVMIGSLFVKEVKYEKNEYFSVAIITIGVFLFNMLNPKEGTTDTIIGLIFIFLSLLMDGLNGFCAEKVKHEYKPSSLEMMRYVNFWSILITIVVLGFSSIGDEISLFAYIEKYPSIIFDILLFSLLSAIGQVFSFRAIKVFGVLTLHVITLTRKNLTVLLSIMMFNHILNGYQWISLSLVFIGTGIIFYDNIRDEGKNKKFDKEIKAMV
ncbi:SLC35B1 [Blepharisma stoltei]|uniref:Uncharacterized protein n=1 Tax=Blepharisma stoltei TaxID=1481888 RepID=A0AAU9IJB0_9CILI|nr:unnamed protein product [Blepharisma stoltei]